MEVDKKLYEEIKEYCKLNGIKPSEYVNSLLKEAFMKDKYGIAPFNRRDPYVGNRAFEDAVNAEIKRIMNDKNELKKAITVNRVESVLVKADEPDRNGIVYTKEALEKAVEQYKENVAIGKDGSICLGELTHPDKNQDKVSKLDDKKVDLDKNSSTNSSNVSQSEKKVVKKHTIKPIK